MAYGPTPTKHHHAGQMTWTPSELPTQGECQGCGQVWKLREVQDRSGKRLWKWVAVMDGDSDPNGAW